MTLTCGTLFAAALPLPATARAQTPEAPMRLRCRFADEDFTCVLVDNPTTDAGDRRAATCR